MGWLTRKPQTAAVTARPVTGAVNLSDGAIAIQGIGDNDVWRAWRELGELHYATTMKARQVGRVDWRITIGGEELDPDDAKTLIEAVTRPQGIRDAASQLALHLEVSGAVEYVEHRENGWMVRPFGSKGGMSASADEENIVERVIHIVRDPANGKPTSSVRAAMPTIRYLLLLGNVGRAAARSRTAQRKILVYPSDIRFADDADFGADLEDAMTAGIKDEHSASAVTNLSIASPADLKDGWFVLDLSAEWDKKLPELVDHAIRRLAMQLDVPPEIILGIGDANHWSGWTIEENTYRAHVEPLASRVGRVFAEAIRKAAGIEAEVVVEPDASELTRRTPSTGDVFRAYELDLVDADYVRSMIGADEDDAPERVEQDRAVTMALDLAKAAPSLAQAPGLDVLVDQIRALLSGGDAPALGEAIAETETVGETRALPETAAALTAATQGEDIGKALARIDQELLIAARPAMHAAIEKARERVGARVRNRVRTDADATKAIDGIPNRDVAAILGQTAIANVDVPTVVNDAVSGMGEWWHGQIGEAWSKVNRTADVQVTGVEEDRDESRNIFELLVAEHVQATLLTPTSHLPAPPTEAARRALAVAGGFGDPNAGVVTAATVDDMPGLAYGPHSIRTLRAEGWRVNQWRWDHDDPEVPHPEHAWLNGKVTTKEGTASTRQGWTAFPGDHKGCLCTVAPFLTRQEGSQ